MRENTFKEVEKIIQINLRWNVLRCVIIDGGKNLCGAGKVLVRQIYKACENIIFLKPIVIHLTICQQVLCRKYLEQLYMIYCFFPALPFINYVIMRKLN